MPTFGAEAEGSPVRFFVDDVHKSYGRRHVLKGVSLRPSGGITAILGRNGAGKSTLVRSLVGMESPSSGVVAIMDDARALSRIELLRAVGWLPQSFGFPNRMKVRDFVSYAAWLKEAIRDDYAVDSALEFADLAEVGDRRIGELSGGTLRRVGLAAAVVHRPSVLVLDEPTAGLDPVQRSSLHDGVRALAKSSKVILATHLLEDVQALADDIAVLDEGHVVWTGGIKDLAAIGDPQLSGTEQLRSGFVAVLQDSAR